MQHIPQEDFSKLKSNVKKVMEKLHSSFKKPNLKKVSSDAEQAKAVVVLVDDDNDDDDFVTQLAQKLTSKHVQKDVHVCSGSSSGDFASQKVRFPPGQDLVLSNKRPLKVAKKFRIPIPKFNP